MPREFALPDLGEGITEAQIIRVLIKPGETIAMDQALMEVETDKAAVEIPSPYAGVAERVHVNEGDTVNVGEVIVTFDGGNGAAKSTPTSGTAGSTSEAPPSAPAPAPEPAPAKAPAAPVAEAKPATRTTTPAAPAVRKLAREKGLDLDAIPATGPGGRVTKDDVLRAASGEAAAASAPAGAAAPMMPAVPRSRPVPSVPLPGVPGSDKWGPVRREKINQIRKTIATQMARSAFTAVHVTHNDDVDITELDSVRRRLSALTDNNPKLTIMSFVIRATCLALQRHPIFNASFDEEAGEIVYKDYVNMGIAVDTERGLIVPVIRNVHTMGLRDIGFQLRTIADRIRTNQFAVDDLRGGTFTITNVGALGGMVSTPIINYPEVAILGLGRSRWTPVVRDDEITKALMLPVNLSFDHRATDGANTARFCGEIMSYLENPSKFLLD